MFKSTIKKIEEMIYSYVDPKLTELKLNSHPSTRNDTAVICEDCGCLVDSAKAIEGTSYITKRRIIHRYADSVEEKIHTPYYCIRHDPGKDPYQQNILNICTVNGHSSFPEWSFRKGTCRVCGQIINKEGEEMIKETAEHILEHKDEYETADFVDWSKQADVDYLVIFNNEISYNEREANAKEGWIDVRITNKMSKFGLPISYYVYENGVQISAHTKLYGNVIIFKVKLGTHELIRKVKDANTNL